MRLINTATLELHDFFHLAWDNDFPIYAILSHCWTANEVTYKDFLKKRKTDCSGHRKVVDCCKFASSRGCEWVWIDSCCIDKRSSTELSEAINSMYRYYAGAKECYAFLEDVEYPYDIPTFRRSRWFTRGWTLQELIAPKSVVFLTKRWKVIGYKRGHRLGLSRDLTGLQITEIEAKVLGWAQSESSGLPASSRSTWWHSVASDEEEMSEERVMYGANLIEELVDITGIPKVILMDPADGLGYFSVATKLSWMSRRSTTRIEDEAYCLLGLFDLNIPLLYGEGGNAFIRLQTEIMRVSSDESILAWRGPGSTHHLLASRPQYFADVPCAWQVRHVERLPYSTTNQGLRFEISPYSGAYVDSDSSLKAPNWILITLNFAVRHDTSAGRRFMYVKRLSCGHYLRRQVRPQTVERILSRHQIEQYVEQEEEQFASYNHCDAASTNGLARESSTAAVELAEALTIYIHLGQSQICKTPGNGGKADFASCIEEQTTMIARWSNVDVWVQQSKGALDGSIAHSLESRMGRA